MADYFGTDHLIAPPITAGPAPSLWQSFTQGVSQQYHVDSAYALDDEVQNRYLKSLRTYEEMTGHKTNFPVDAEFLDDYIRTVQGSGPSYWHRNVFTGELGQRYQEYIAEFQKANEGIKALNRPDIPSMEQVIADVSQMQHGVEQESERQSETSGIGATIGRFIGGAVGSMTPRDPLNLATLPIGGFGKSVATRIATEGAVQAAITGVTDVSAVNPNREFIGLPAHNTMYDMLLAAAGGAVLRGLGEGVHAGVRRFVGETPTVEPKPAGPTNDELRQVLDTLPDNPRVRAGKSILDAVEDIERVNPYGDSLNGHARFMEELRRVQNAMNGEPETAIARFLPPLAEVPSEHIESNFDFQLVREQQPDLYDRMKTAQAAVGEVEQRIASAEQKINASEQEVLIVHGGRDFDKIDPTHFGSGEPGGIRPLGKGLYGFAFNPKNKAEALQAINHARHFANKYGKDSPTVHVFGADLRNAEVSSNGPTVEGLKGRPPSAEQERVREAYAKANSLPPGPERSAAFDEAKALAEQFPAPSPDFRVEQLPGGNKEIAALSHDKLQRVGKFSAGISEEDILKNLSSSRDDIKTLRKSRKAAVRRYKDAFNAVQAEADRIKLHRDIVARAQAAKETSAIVAGGAGRPFPPISKQAAEDLSVTVKAAEEAMPERMDHIVSSQPKVGYDSAAGTFSGSVELVHGTSGKSPPVFSETGKFKGVRYDEGGNLFGNDAVYLGADKSWFNGSRYGLSFDKHWKVKTTFSRAYVLTPDKMKEFLESIKDKEGYSLQNTAKALKDLGYDGLIIHDLSSTDIAKAVAAKDKEFLGEIYKKADAEGIAPVKVPGFKEAQRASFEAATKDLGITLPPDISDAQLDRLLDALDNQVLAFNPEKQLQVIGERTDAATMKDIDVLNTHQEGMVDIGLEQPVPGERFFLDEGGQKVTFAKAMADLVDDDRTTEAMRTCLL